MTISYSLIDGLVVKRPAHLKRNDYIGYHAKTIKQDEEEKRPAKSQNSRRISVSTLGGLKANITKID